MKTFLFLLWLLPTVCFAQTDSVKIKSYNIFCNLYLAGNLFSKNYYKADFGKKSNAPNLFNDEFRKLNQQLAQYDQEIDALNYMAEQGWEFVTSTPKRDEPNIYLLKKKVSP